MPSYCDADGTTNYAKLIDMLSNHEQRNQIIADTALTYHQLGKSQLILCTRIAQVKALTDLLSPLLRCEYDYRHDKRVESRL